MKKIRVLYLNPFSQAVSGPDESLLALLEAVIPLGVEPTLILPAPGPQVARYEKLGVRVFYVPLTVLKRKLSPTDVALLGARFGRSSLRVAQIARRVKADLIHTNMEVLFEGGLAAKALRIPHVMHYRGNTLDEPKPVFDALVLAWTLLARKIFCISDATAWIFKVRRRDEKVEVLYNPIRIREIGAAERSERVRAELGASGDELLIGTVGRIHPRKDLLTFVKACGVVGRSLPEARFVVVGAAEGADEERYLRELQAEAKREGLEGRLHFAGARRDVAQVMKALDVFVLTSRHEGFGRVVGEAMAASRAVVVSREGALPELVSEGVQGYCVDPGDAPAFAEKIERLARSSADRERMGEQGRQRAQAFDVVSVGARVFETYQRLLSAKR